MSPSAEGAPHTLQRIALHHGNRRPHHQHDGVPYDHVEDHFALHRSLATSLRSAHTLPQVTVRVFIAVLLPLKHSIPRAIPQPVENVESGFLECVNVFAKRTVKASA